MMDSRRLEKWVDPRLYGSESKIHGRGLFTHAAVAPGEILMRWGGILIPIADYDKLRYHSTSTSSYDEMHYLTTPIDEPHGLDELMNHSCDPNLWLEDAVTVSARRFISMGEELTSDFAIWEDSGHTITEDCRCGTADCRRVITARDWRIPVLQARYAGHFLPHINDAIKAIGR